MKLIVIILFFPVLCFCQEKNAPSSLIFKVNSSALFDLFSFPTLQFSLEKKIARNLSLSTEFGYQIYNLRKVDTAFIHPSGLKFNIEARLYNLFSSQQIASEYANLEGGYIGLNLFYRTNKYNHQLEYSKPDDPVQYNDCFIVDKRNHGVNILFGYQQRLSRSFLLDFYLGIGAMKVEFKNSHLEIALDDRLSGTDLVPLFASWNLSESSGWRANPNLGVRVCIAIW